MDRYHTLLIAKLNKELLQIFRQYLNVFLKVVYFTHLTSCSMLEDTRHAVFFFFFFVSYIFTMLRFLLRNPVMVFQLNN